MRKGKQSDEAATEKRRLLAQLEADGSSEVEFCSDDDDEDSPDRVYTAEVQRAREEQRLRAAQRREAILRAAQREERKTADQEARRAARERAGHLGSSPGKGANPVRKKI